MRVPMPVKDIAIDDRIITADLGYAGTVIALVGDSAYVLFDYQRPSSEPKPIPLGNLKLVSG